MGSRALWGICVLAVIFSGAPYRHLILAAGYVLAAFFCFRIQADYPLHSRMRLAWRLIAASCALAVLRYTFDWVAGQWRGVMSTDLVSLRQIPIALTLILLTGGLVTMWTCFSALGLGTRFRRLDIVGFAATAACVPFVFSLREGMADAHSGYAFIRYIQAASPLLLAAPALTALALHRISYEMGESTLALSLRLLTLSLVLRLVSLWISSSALRGKPVLLAIAFAAHSAATWIFAQAVFQRWSLTVRADSLAQRYQDDPAREIAELSRHLVV